MSRKANKAMRCSECKMKNIMCICDLIKPLENQTFITIIMHHRENLTTTNTARLAHKMLKNSNVFYRGLIDSPLDPNLIIQKAYKPIYLFPSESAKVLTAKEFDGQKIQLIIPDGSWRQARKFSKREKFLQEMPHYQLPNNCINHFHLRRKIKQNGVSTLEAIAYSLGLIENKELETGLISILKEMVTRTLSTRGIKKEYFS